MKPANPNFFTIPLQTTLCGTSMAAIPPTENYCFLKSL
jgi:hypothetical protein